MDLLSSGIARGAEPREGMLETQAAATACGTVEDRMKNRSVVLIASLSQHTPREP